MNDDERMAVETVYAALADQDRPRLRRLLHPYLVWAGVDGITVRGRTKVLALLEEQRTPEQPRAIELRDGQIYRWQTS